MAERQQRSGDDCSVRKQPSRFTIRYMRLHMRLLDYTCVALRSPYHRPRERATDASFMLSSPAASELLFALLNRILFLTSRSLRHAEAYTRVCE